MNLTMKQPFYPTGILLAVLFLISCENKQDISDYYFPVTGDEMGVVYEYRSALDEMDPPFYWYTRTVQTDSATYLVRAYYDHQYQPYQLLREEVVSNGVLLADYRLYETDSTGKQQEVPVQIGGANLFSFELDKEDPGVLFFKISFEMPNDANGVTTLIRNRQYIGDTTWTYQGQTYDALRFYVRELVDIQSEGHAEHEFDGEEIYAEGLGLVYYSKNISENFKTAYALHDTFSMAELERRFEESRGLDSLNLLQ